MENYLFFNSKYTSPFTLNADYLINHTKIKGRLINYDPMKQSFLFLPNDNPKRPIIVPQDFPILNDDSLLQEDIPKSKSDPLPPIQPIASQPLGDCEKSYYYATAKKDILIMNSYSLFLISFQLLQKEIRKKTKEQIKNLQRNQQMTFLNQNVFNLLKKYKNINN